ncbi:uncharacterized protein LOC113202931 [Frankliniella occidentalis]|uniref:Uncharacterized protein LOC113202931 n=1 Tax=Frankliniella occidentalis TaxID=133901 RepID=A0A6J1RWG4_FRAOC|nr:uncharacterized protein LOC113202931 [Frankliniella occidentalis]
MSTPKLPERPMEYPYTHTARLMAFPWKMHLKHANWRWRWGLIGYAATLPFFIWMSSALNGPGNQQKLREVRAKIAKEHEEHLKHLL